MPRLSLELLDATPASPQAQPGWEAQSGTFGEYFCAVTARRGGGCHEGTVGSSGFLMFPSNPANQEFSTPFKARPTDEELGAGW